MPRSSITSLGATPAPPTGGALTPRLWALLSVLAANMLIDALEVSVALIALPSIAEDFGLTLAAAQWTVTAFAIGFGGLLLFGTRLVAHLGRRPVYLAGLLGFAAASLAGALATDPALLMATRMIKGFCAALTAPTGLAIISTTFPEGGPRSRALSVYTLFGAGGFTTGLLLSGALTGIDWRLTFAFPAPVVLVLCIFAWRLIPVTAPTPTPAARRRWDATGAVTLLLTLLTATAGLTTAGSRGATHALPLALLTASLLLLAVFIRVELRAPDPLVPLAALTGAALWRSALGAAALNGSYLGLLLTLSHRLQTEGGFSPMQTAVTFVPAAAPLAVSALASGRLVAAVGAPRLIAAGALCALTGYALLLRPAAPLDRFTTLLPTLLLVGIAFVLSFAALNLQATSQLPPEQHGPASALYQTGVQAAAALVPAAVAALLTARPAAAGTAQLDQAQRPALLLVAAIGAFGLLVALTGLRPTRGGTGPGAPADTRPGSRNP